MQIELNQVKQTYNGRSGCMCGCNGKYSVHTQENLELMNKRNGYEYFDKDEVNPRKVKLALNKVNKYLAMSKIDLKNVGIDAGVHTGGDLNFAWVKMNGRNTVVYFN